MDAKKLQQLQQAQAQAHKKLPLAYQTNIADYRTATHSPAFHPGSYAAQAQLYQQSPTATSSSGGGPLSPIDMQPQANAKLLMKHAGPPSGSSHSSPYHQSSSYASGEQLYQSPNERTYLAAAGRLQAGLGQNHANALQQQYQQLQQAKLQVQLQTQSEAVHQQQRTFALRQAMNPPVPQGHYHMSQSSSIMSSVTLQQQQQQQHQQQAQQAQQQQHGGNGQRAPPSSLNLASQFQPASGPLKVNQKSGPDHQLYAQQQLQLQLQLQHQQQLQQQHHQHMQQQQQQHQRLKSEAQTPADQSPVYIQQNHPGHVVNQACQTQISAVKPGLVTQKGTPSSEDSSSKSPPHMPPLDRKKSVGSMQALKSPVTKRPPSSPVTLSGWLYKQGSDGLKVWRKRWFVLAEYCLYYYKGPEEEKLLGSILLPSYRVSACLPEDRIYRKFAFKCEHQNMRTYWLAAETGDAMVQWVRALTAATTMQAPPSSGGDSDQNSQPSASSSLNHSGENSDSGIHTLQSQQSKMSLGQVTPASDNGGNTKQQGQAQPQHGGAPGGAQPLYANAPPKPRRINDGGYSSPSPEHSVDNERKHQQQQRGGGQRSGIMSPTLQQMQHRGMQQPQQHHAIYDARTGNVSSALRLQQNQQQYSVDNLEAQFQQQMGVVEGREEYAGKPTVAAPAQLNNYMDMEEQIMRLQQQQQQQQQRSGGDDIYGERELHMQKLMQRYPAHLGPYGNAERRTPDAYGRSKNRLFSDYEDIYNLAQAAAGAGTQIPTSAQEALMLEAASYRRPLSPPSYDGSKHVPAMPTRYTPNHLEASQAHLMAGAVNARGRLPSGGIMRPHSADFLEYEARAEAEVANVNLAAAGAALKPDPMRAQRPKSSLDINRTPDSFYYSEASYAEKMRKSALYLQHPQGGQAGAGGGAAAAQPQQAGPYRTEFLSPVGNGMNTIGYENPYERSYKRNELAGDQGAASIPRMSRSMGGKVAGAGGPQGAQIRSASSHPPQPQAMSPPPPQGAVPTITPSMSTQQIIQQNEQFLRSASARLPKRSGGFGDDDSAGLTSPPSTGSGSGSGANSSPAQDGERKREESMKRLLEWKQRMLQSPLTRKGVQLTAQASNMTAMSKLGSNPNILLASTTVASGAVYGPQGASSAAGLDSNALQRSRSDSQTNMGPPVAGYNSYSSDDEASISVRNVRNLPKGNLTVKPAPAEAQAAATTTTTPATHQQHAHQQQQLQAHQQQHQQLQPHHHPHHHPHQSIHPNTQYQNQNDQKQQHFNQQQQQTPNQQQQTPNQQQQHFNQQQQHPKQQQQHISQQQHLNQQQQHPNQQQQHPNLQQQHQHKLQQQHTHPAPTNQIHGKPQPSTHHPPAQLQQQQKPPPNTYDEMTKLTNSYYGTAADTKYAKTTTLTGNAGGVAMAGGGIYNNGYNGYDGGSGAGSNLLASSTPLHPGIGNGIDYYNGGGGGGGGGGSMYDIHQPLNGYPMRRIGSRAEIDMLERETSTQIKNLDVSAGDLLSRTHEELVLLLIQLRRQNSNTARAIEQCCTDIHDTQNRLRSAEGLTRAESIQRLDYLKQHLLDLERQYEKSKPLVNLVDNMVKLGSLYRNNNNNERQISQRNEALTMDQLEFNQRLQEQRMLEEEQMQWDRLSPNQAELQSKVDQLYHLDQLLQEESGTLQSLQRDKEDLERALGGIRARIHDTNSQPLAVEAAKKQQHMLERELSRVHQLLAENSKKLEQTVAGNSRLEQELLVLRQKLQLTRGSNSDFSQAISDTYASNTAAMLESELKRVQTLVGDMQRQRQELSAAVRQLTENSSRLYQEIGNKEHLTNGGGSLNGSMKKRSNPNCWIETDLDSMESVNRTVGDSTLNLSTPLYVDTGSANSSGGNLLNCSNGSSKLSDYNTGDSLSNELPVTRQRRASAGERHSYQRYNDSSDTLETSGVDSDGFLESNPFANLSAQEKQEIKTVRIVKRESERRHRDRSERSGLSASSQNLDQVMEEEFNYQHSNGGYNGMEESMGGAAPTNHRSKSLPRSYNDPAPRSRRHHHQHGDAKQYSGGYYTNGYDKNSNFPQQQQDHRSAAERHHQQQQQHLNPLANAYFAKQLQLQQQQRHTRDSSQVALRQKTDSLQSLNKSLTDLSPGPVFQSEAARQIINEMSAGSASEDTEKIVEKVPAQHKHRRAVPREKRRHYTAPNNVNQKAMENVQAENDMNRNNTNWRARDDLDMEVALRPRMNAPDVVRSALGQGEKISENSIDNLFLAPNKIVIPERYIPETTPELSPEEKKRRQEKVESIKKMLAETPISSANDAETMPSSKLNAEKKQREHLLQLNQILAQQVMQMSKIVAGNPHSQSNQK